MTAAGKTVVGLNAVLYAPAGNADKLFRLDKNSNSWTAINLTIKNLHPGNIEADKYRQLFLVYTGMYHQDQKNYALCDAFSK